MSYCSKTQSITATSSNDAEFLAAVVAAKQAKYLRAVMQEIGFRQEGPTPLFEDNMSAITLVNTVYRPAVPDTLIFNFLPFKIGVSKVLFT